MGSTAEAQPEAMQLRREFSRMSRSDKSRGDFLSIFKIGRVPTSAEAVEPSENLLKRPSQNWINKRSKFKPQLRKQQKRNKRTMRSSIIISSAKQETKNKYEADENLRNKHPPSAPSKEFTRHLPDVPRTSSEPRVSEEGDVLDEDILLTPEAKFAFPSHFHETQVSRNRQFVPSQRRSPTLSVMEYVHQIDPSKCHPLEEIFTSRRTRLRHLACMALGSNENQPTCRASLVEQLMERLTGCSPKSMRQWSQCQQNQESFVSSGLVHPEMLELSQDTIRAEDGNDQELWGGVGDESFKSQDWAINELQAELTSIEQLGNSLITTSWGLGLSSPPHSPPADIDFYFLCGDDALSRTRYPLGAFGSSEDGMSGHYQLNVSYSGIEFLEKRHLTWEEKTSICLDASELMNNSENDRHLSLPPASKVELLSSCSDFEHSIDPPGSHASSPSPLPWK
ncbi:hypothetical protein MPTK1_8g08150 [Marchantia polymorpha subsp. ruderalis]|uniref:Uncharacterized protein n=1 Tax=Marchantia polymorpha TaxID=3197 RepID=A0A2R6W4F0_MARPO|nr:hypothetical protein MARPO_0155s0004 [Marchantia polymorpha]BBN19132.1 hypothetical protein Mp_8g08150 [Marchantia polymorpha subsp. ruderalis]|eukprot:PTQ28739.1 hypothetical protein MARPO_0155s0004 [Marchantia polymorpha]